MLGLRRCGDAVAADVDRLLAGLDDSLERVALVARVALDRLDQVGNKIVTALQLHVDPAPTILGTDAEPNQTVVHDDEQKPEHDDKAEGAIKVPVHSISPGSTVFCSWESTGT